MDRDQREAATTGHDPSAGSITEAPRGGEAVEDFFGTDQIFRRVLATADEELARPSLLLFWSALSAGLVLGFSLLARALMGAAFPEAAAGLLGNLLYPIGFIAVILGRYQLFTENTLTPVTLVLTRFAGLGQLLRFWGVVFGGNLLGAALFALLAAGTSAFEPDMKEAALAFGRHLVEASWGTAFVRALLAGWLLALLVWLVYAAREAVARLLLIWLLIFLQVSAGLFHCVVGSIEVLFLVFSGEASLLMFARDFLVPVTLGNTVGGVVFVALLNWAQFSEEGEYFSSERERLPWRAWLTRWH